MNENDAKPSHAGPFCCRLPRVKDCPPEGMLEEESFPFLTFWRVLVLLVLLCLVLAAVVWWQILRGLEV